MKKTQVLLGILLLNLTLGFSSGLMANNELKPGKFVRAKAKADKNFESYSYSRAIEYYKKAYELLNDAEVELSLANSYRLLNQPLEAEKWYRLALENQVMSNEDMLNYGQILSANGRYVEALGIFQEYEHLEDWVEGHAEALKDVERFYFNQKAFQIQLALFNSPAKDFSPTFFKDEVVFVTARPSKGLFKPKFNWDGSNFLDLFSVSEDGGLPQKLPRGINTRFHEGPASYFENDTKVIFTRNNYSRKKAGKSEEGVNLLKLYFSEQKEDDSWSRPVEFPYNSDQYSTGHPAVSKDGSLMYFASDMPGGFGGVDLYSSEYKDGKWQMPVNLGERFNTSEDEMFPSLHNESILYFSSTGHHGLGGLDLFRASLLDSLAPQNLGFPLNTKADDFGLAMKNDLNEGYFSSNRDGGVGDDDIYQIHIYDLSIKVNLIDSLTREQIFGEIAVTNDMLSEADAPFISVSSQTSVKFSGLLGSSFSIDGVAEGYHPGDMTIKTADKPKDATELVFDLPLLPLRKESTRILIVENNGLNTQVFWHKDDGYIPFSGTVDSLKAHLKAERIDLTSELKLKNVYYNFDKHKIRKDAATDLDKIFDFLIENDNASISLASHTDVRGTLKYNERLAKRRVDAAKKYLEKKGIDGKRIDISSFGEYKTFNDCLENDCSDTNHQSNRRTEIVITFSNKE